MLAEAWVLLIAMDLALRLIPFRALLATLTGQIKPRQEQSQVSPSLPRLIWLVETAGRIVPVSITCLKQAMVLSWLLKRRGIATTIQIGVISQEGTLKAHAWLEQRGTVIFGGSGDTEQYHRLRPAHSR